MSNETFLKSAEAVYSNGSQAEVAEPVVPAAEVQASAEIAVEEPAPAIENTPALEETPAAETPVGEPYNIWTELEQKTDGLVKDEETFKSLVEKSKSYETLATEKAELERNQFKPANDYVAKFNELILGGANSDQIKSFVKLNEYGNLEDLNPIEAKVAKMVLLDGYSEDVARKMVNREFDLSQFDEQDPYQKESADIMREQLRISAKQDLESLKDYRKDLSVVHNPEKESAEQRKLEEVAKISTYNKTVEQEATNMAKNFPSKLSHDIKVGDETVKYEDSIDSEWLEKELPKLMVDYFKDSLDPINNETLTQAYSHAYGEYLKANDQKRLERVAQKFYNEGVEKTVNKYENRSGLPRSEENIVVTPNETGMDDFMKRLVGKK